MTEDNAPRPVTVLRCETCGDTFPAEDARRIECPSCGGTDLDVASEPLL